MTKVEQAALQETLKEQEEALTACLKSLKKVVDRLDKIESFIRGEVDDSQPIPPPPQAGNALRR